MIAPDIWFTLYALARKGATHRIVTLTTRELGFLMGISQQTASRRISRCVEEGLVSRIHMATGMRIQLTDRGRRELADVCKALEIALVPPANEIIIKGHLVTGLGEGAYYVEMYASRFEMALGFKPFPGTLNVRVLDEMSRKSVSRMRQSPPLIVQGFTYEGRTFGDVVCYRVRVNNRVDAAVVIAQRTHHSEDILEIVAPVNLRKKLRLRDSSEVVLTLVPLHRAGGTQ